MRCPMPEIITEKATAPELHQMLVAVVGYSKRSFVAMGKLLFALKYDNQYRNAIGSGINTWEDYLKQPEIGLAAGEANRLIQIYEEFCLRLGYDEDTISAIPVKNIHYLLPIVRKFDDREDTDELVADATFLSQRDFKERLYDRKVEQGEPTRTFEYMVMAKTVETGTMSRVMDIDSETIKRTFNLD